VVGPNRREQDEVVASIVAEFAREPKPPTVKDRREFPSFGYRAVHVIVFDDGLPVEVQARTALQDLWAQAIERLGDRWGRGIRYGEEPSDPDELALGGAGGITRRDLLGTMQHVSSLIDEIERSRLMLMDAEDALASLSQAQHDEEDEEVLALKTDARDAKGRLEAQQAAIAITLRSLVRYLEKGAGA
jgi:Region found in RelA / SpoT proteins